MFEEKIHGLLRFVNDLIKKSYAEQFSKQDPAGRASIT